MWLHLRGKGRDVARCTIEQLYRQQSWIGALRQRRLKALPSAGTERPVDLVDRQFGALRPNQLWVADFTYSAQPVVMCSSPPGEALSGLRALDSVRSPARGRCA